MADKKKFNIDSEWNKEIISEKYTDDSQPKLFINKQKEIAYYQATFSYLYFLQCEMLRVSFEFENEKYFNALQKAYNELAEKINFSTIQDSLS